jgi:hypothetical protein
MAARALALWKEHQQRWQTALSVQTGALFLSPKNDPYLSLSAEALTREGIAFERFTPAEAGRRYPQIQLSAFEAPEPHGGRTLRGRRR